MLNITCGISINSHHDFYVLYNPCGDKQDGAHIPTTTSLWAVLGAISMVLAIVINFCYNSVTVLQYRIFVPALSNSLWIGYFAIASSRAIIVSIVYAKAYHSEGYFMTNWILGSFEILMFCFALNYQRRFRSVAKVAIEPEDTTNEFVKFIKGITHYEKFLVVEFLLIIVAILLFRFMSNNHAVWFWVYVGISFILICNGLLISCMIAYKKSFDEPALITKIYFVLSVILCIPERIPMFVWNNCASENQLCWSHHFDLLDLFLVFKIISVIVIFRALYKEYHRLKTECQYSLLCEVEGYSFE